MLIDVDRLPGVADPDVADGAGSVVPATFLDIGGEDALLLLVLVLWVVAPTVRTELKEK